MVDIEGLKALKYTFLFAVSVVVKKERIFKEESVEILKIVGLINNIEQYQKNMAEENISQKFRSRYIKQIISLTK